MKIVLCAGHDSVKDVGAVTKLNGVQYTEQSLMIRQRNLVKFYLEKVGHTVITDGLHENNKVLREAVKLIPQGQIAVDLHLNASADKKACGVEVLSKPVHKTLSKKIAQAVSKTMGIKTRRDEGWSEYSKTGRKLCFIDNGGIIVESFFLSNDDELQIYLNKEWAVARAIATAIHNHYSKGEDFDTVFAKK